MENTFHPSGQTSNSLDREIDEYFIFFPLGIDALDTISFRVGYNINTIIITLLFARRLVLGIDFCFVMGAWMFALTLVLLFGLRYFLALR